MSGTNLTLIDLAREIEDTQKSMNVFFLVVFGNMVLLMQCGFAFLEAGSVRSKNTSNILIKNLLDSFVAGVTYWVIGYAFAYGKGNSFIGWTKWVSNDVDNLELASWYFQFVFAATAATIVSGAIAERCEFVAYLVYSTCITGLVYPIVTHWVWAEGGWLVRGQVYTIDGEDVTIGYQDFAGSGVVHTLGGVAAFCGAVITGPRLGRFHPESGNALPLRGHSVPLVALGGFILIFGFMAFNGGSQLAIATVDDSSTIALVITNTVLSGSAAAFTTLLITKINCFGTKHNWSLLQTLNGGLTGMVAICAGCNAVQPWSSFIIGSIGGVVFKITSFLIIKMKVDDPLDAVSVHFGGGVWGVLSVAFFKWDDGILFQWNQKSGYMLGWQIAGILAITAWTAVLSGLMFGAMKLFGILRVSPELEFKGLDIAKHGEPAYPLESYGHGYLESIRTILENGELGKTEEGFVDGKQLKTEEGHCETLEVLSMRQKGADLGSASSNANVSQATTTTDISPMENSRM